MLINGSSSALFGVLRMLSCLHLEALTQNLVSQTISGSSQLAAQFFISPLGLVLQFSHQLTCDSKIKVLGRPARAP